MRARRKDNGEIIKVLESNGIYCEFGEDGHIVSLYTSSDLDFDVQNEGYETLEGYIYRDRGVDFNMGLSIQRSIRSETLLSKGSSPNIKSDDGIFPRHPHH